MTIDDDNGGSKSKRSFKMLGKAIASDKKRKATSQFYTDVGVVPDDKDKREVGDPLKDRAATLPAASDVITSVDVADGKPRIRSKKSRRRHTLAISNENQLASHLNNVADKKEFKSEENIDAKEPDRKANADMTVGAPVPSRGGKQSRKRRRRHTTMVFGLFGGAVMTEGQRTSHFYHDDLNDEVVKEK